MWRKIFKPPVTILALIITFTVGVGFSYAPPVLFRTYHFGAISERPIAVFNPLRDRAPERLGDAVLAQMKAGEYSQVLEPHVSDAERRKHIYLREAEYPIESWVLGDRYDNGIEVTLLYWAKRKNYPSDARISIFIERYNGGLRVDGYNPLY